jgi:uncharacterized protein DUF4388
LPENTVLRGSLRAIPLPSLIGLLADARSSGELNVFSGGWRARLALLDGRLVGASLGPERGRPALAAIAWMLRAGEFNLSASLSSDAAELDLDLCELSDIWTEGEALSLVVPGPDAVPRIALERMPSEADSRSFDVSTIKTLVAIDGQRTVADIARNGGFVRTVRELATLARAGIVDFGAAEPPSAFIEPSASRAVAAPSSTRTVGRLAGLFLKPPKSSAPRVL